MQIREKGTKENTSPLGSPRCWGMGVLIDSSLLSATRLSMFWGICKALRIQGGIKLCYPLEISQLNGHHSAISKVQENRRQTI